MNYLFDQIRRACSLFFGVVIASLWISPAFALVDFPIGYASTGGSYAFIALIQQQRLLEQEGIRPAFIYVGGPQITQALIAGDMRMAIVAAASPIRAAARGADLRFVGGVLDRDVISVMVEPTIRTPDALKGKRMAIDRFGDYTDYLARKYLQKVGLEPQKDVLLMQIGGQTIRLAALQSGQVQAAFVGPPLTLVAEKAGLHTLANLGDLGFPSSSASFVVTRSTTERSEKEVYGVVRAVAKALAIYKADKEAAFNAMSHFMKLKDRESLEETWRIHAKFYKSIPSPAVEGIKAVHDFLGQTDRGVQELNFNQIIDTRFTDRLKREMGDK